jgi:pimeloyl-ACP methyl ester carboxylesterase
MQHYTEGWCRSADGTSIFYSMAGPGVASKEPDVILADGLGCDGFVWKYLAPELARRHRVIRFHYRGHGRSGLPVELGNLGIEDMVADLAAVMDHCEVNAPAVLGGHSMGVQVILEAHRRMPERVAALMPMCGSYGHPLDTFHDGQHFKKAFPYVYRLFTGFPEAVMRLWRTLLPSRLAYWTALVAGEVNRSLIRIEDMQPYFDHLGRMDAEVFVRVLLHASEHSARGHLSSIGVPTLVVGGEEDTFTPAWLSHEMAEHVPDADLLVVPRGSHVAPLEQPELLSLRVEKFLKERVGCYRRGRKAAGGRGEAKAAPARAQPKRRKAAG